MERDFKMKRALCFDDVLLVPNHSEVLSRKGVDLSQTLYGHNYNLKLQIPLLGAPMDTVVSHHMAMTLSKMGGLGILHRYNSIENQAALVSSIYETKGEVGVAIPATRNYMERFNACYNAGARVFCIDIAHGDHVLMIEAVKALYKQNAPIYIIAGNVATYSAAKRLIDAGADCIRTSVGGGSSCSTRVVTGFGVPTLEAVMEIANHVRYNFPNVAVLADGGIRNSGDAVKCLVAGAHLVMCGQMLAATSDSPGGFLSENNKQYKTFRGMASKKSMTDWDPSRVDTTPEGVEHLLPYKGKTVDVVNEFLGGIRSGFSYAGVSRMEDIYNSAEFIEITQNGLKESLPHVD